MLKIAGGIVLAVIVLWVLKVVLWGIGASIFGVSDQSDND